MHAASRRIHLLLIRRGREECPENLPVDLGGSHGVDLSERWEDHELHAAQLNARETASLHRCPASGRVQGLTDPDLDYFFILCDVARSETLLFRGLPFVANVSTLLARTEDRQVPAVLSTSTAASELEAAATQKYQ